MLIHIHSLTNNHTAMMMKHTGIQQAKTNAWNCLQLLPALAFLSRHPDCLWNIMALSLAATIAQLFISYTIKTFGALLFATVMTTRQFLSILLSCVLFIHPLSTGQTMATGVVFGALYYKNLMGKKKEQSSKSSEVTKEAVQYEKTSELPESQSALERLVAAGR
jgi:hypothetical protein